MISSKNWGVFVKTFSGQKKHPFDSSAIWERSNLPLEGRLKVMIRIRRLVKGSILISVGTETDSNPFRGERKSDWRWYRSNLISIVRLKRIAQNKTNKQNSVHLFSSINLRIERS